MKKRDRILKDLKDALNDWYIEGYLLLITRTKGEFPVLCLSVDFASEYIVSTLEDDCDLADVDFYESEWGRFDEDDEEEPYGIFFRASGHVYSFDVLPIGIQQ